MNATIKTLFCVVMLVLASTTRAQDFEALKAAVVKVTSEFNGKRKTGTGFIVKLDADAVSIATASHVIEGDAAPRVEFFVQRNRALPAEVAKSEGGDPKGLALLIVRGKPPAGLLAVALAPQSELPSGDEVATIGFGRGQGDWGVIRARIASFDGRDLKLDGSIKEGNSGGPLFKGGSVVGLVTSIDRDFALATPAPVVNSVLANWGVSLNIAKPVATPDARAAAERAVQSQANALDAIAQALNEQVTKPIAAQTAAAQTSQAINLGWFAGKWEGFARTQPGHVAGNASYVDITADGSFRVNGYWVGAWQGKLQLQGDRVTYETAKQRKGGVTIGKNDEGVDTLVFDNVLPAANSGRSEPLWVEVQRVKQ